MGYIDKNGRYYEGDRAGDDLEVPKRPSLFHDWNGSSWSIGSVGQKALLEGCEAELQKALDAGAQAWEYDDIKTAVGYVGDPFPRFNAEAIALRNWRSAVWVWAGQFKADILAGHASMPASIEAFIAQMPSLPARPA